MPCWRRYGTFFLGSFFLFFIFLLLHYFSFVIDNLFYIIYLTYPILSYPILLYLHLSYITTLSYPILHNLIISCPIWSYPISHLLVLTFLFSPIQFFSTVWLFTSNSLPWIKTRKTPIQNTTQQYTTILNNTQKSTILNIILFHHILFRFILKYSNHLLSYLVLLYKFWDYSILNTTHYLHLILSFVVYWCFSCFYSRETVWSEQSDSRTKLDRKEKES